MKSILLTALAAAAALTTAVADDYTRVIFSDDFSSNSFGPLFAERALTNGKGVISLAANFQQFAWKSYEGSNLRNDDSGLYWGHWDYDGLGSGYWVLPVGGPDPINAGGRPDIIRTVRSAGYALDADGKL